MLSHYGQLMKQNKLAKTIGCCFLLSLQLGASNSIRAQGHRIPRPSAAAASAAATGSGSTSSSTPAPPTAKVTTDAQAQPSDEAQPTGSTTSPAASSPTGANLASIPTNTLKANASVTLEEQPNPAYPHAIINWQNKNLPNDLQERYGGTTDNSNGGPHKGLKAHLGGAMVKAVGTVANAYVPIASVHLTNAEPKIEIVPGHCPAAFDPAFQIPVRWWDTLSQEEGSAALGPQWKLWLTAVQYVFQAHARELRETPGVASLHVMVNPDGSFFNISIYSGAERGNQGHNMNARTMEHLRQIIMSIGQLPPFPAWSKVRCYHLIFNGSAGI